MAQRLRSAGSRCGLRDRLAQPAGLAVNDNQLADLLPDPFFHQQEYVDVIRYIKEAFSNRWNLLALMGGVGFALLSGHADVALPLVLAAEAGYLTILGSQPKFQKYVDVREAKDKRQGHQQRGRVAASNLLRSLPRNLRDRYDRLRERCVELQHIASDLKQTRFEDYDLSLESLQVAGLDRLLWVFLKLLFTYQSLQKFLDRTSLQRIRNDVDRIENRLKAIDPNDTSPHAEKIRRTLEDNLATSQDRISNYQRARANLEFVEFEIDRLENKIKSLAEVAVNRQEPDYISGQVDQVAKSMMDTERTMNELQVFTGLGQIDDEVPELLRSTVREQ